MRLNELLFEGTATAKVKTINVMILTGTGSIKFLPFSSHIVLPQPLIDKE